MKKIDWIAVLLIFETIIALVLAMILAQKERENIMVKRENIKIKHELSEIIKNKPSAALTKALKKIHIGKNVLQPNTWPLPHLRYIDLTINKDVFKSNYSSDQISMRIYTCKDMWPPDQILSEDGSGELGDMEMFPMTCEVWFESNSKYYPSETYPIGDIIIREFDSVNGDMHYELNLDKKIIDKKNQKNKSDFIKGIRHNG